MPADKILKTNHQYILIAKAAEHSMVCLQEVRQQVQGRIAVSTCEIMFAVAARFGLPSAGLTQTLWSISRGQAGQMAGAHGVQ